VCVEPSALMNSSCFLDNCVVAAKYSLSLFFGYFMYFREVDEKRYEIQCTGL
jgi:hypothetical protein